MDILVSFTAEIAKYTVAPIGRQAGYLLFYKGNFKKLTDSVKDLEGARVRMDHSVEEEKGNGKEIYTDVVDWLEKVNDLIEKANQLQKDPRRANVGCSRWSFPNLICRHQLMKLKKDDVENAADLDKRKLTIGEFCDAENEVFHSVVASIPPTKSLAVISTHAHGK